MPKQDNITQKDSKKRPRQVPLSGKMKLAKHIEPVRNHQEAFERSKSAKGIPFTSKFNVKTMDAQMRSRSPSVSPMDRSPVVSGPPSRRSSVGYNPPGSPQFGGPSPPHDFESLVPTRSSSVLSSIDLQILCLLAASQEEHMLSKRPEDPLRAPSLPNPTTQAIKQLSFDMMDGNQSEIPQSAPSFDTQQYLNLLREIQRNAEMIRHS